MAAEAAFLHVIISLGILLFAAKLMAELFHRIKQPIVLGELLAGVIVGPFAIGGLPLLDGEPLIVLDETVKHVGEIAAVVILFIAGLEITPREFLKGGAAAFTIGSLGQIVLVPCRLIYQCPLSSEIQRLLGRILKRGGHGILNSGVFG